jgi:phage gp37-like protein
MKIDELQNAMVTGFKELFPELAACRAYAGRFNLQELGALSVKTPAIFVSYLGIKGIQEAGDERMDLVCQFAAYIVTTDQRGLPRDAAAKNMSEAIAVWLPNRRFGVLDVGVPRDLRVDNLYDGSVRSKAVALAAVSWTQLVRTGTSVFAEDGTLPTEVYAVHDEEARQVAGEV